MKILLAQGGNALAALPLRIIANLTLADCAPTHITADEKASRPYGQSAWEGKPAGILGVSAGAIGTAMAQQHLRNVLACLGVPTPGQPEAFIQAREGLFDESGNLGADRKKFLQGWMDSYVAWVIKHVA